MKNVITTLVLIVTLLGFSQTKPANGILVEETTRVENVSIIVTVDSAEEIASSFKLEDIKEILELSSDNEIVSFKLVCNGSKMSGKLKSNRSYKIDGNSNDVDAFLFAVEKIRTAAISYYKNKN
ncbi:hypothetical protein [uncultured Winogradskyella sp.]|uniref:hypothetical protein n=1 Tax=uncultured Winogradskyella sp. TaxID=395353 RepID=UPI0030DA58C8|tara:strand:+ start:102560 stop:102931 length:372 start_codon:yes stop_codon:yes gene_type:complete